jgi:pimeloyl-ACP methyl ester carboxylesterase
MKKLAKYFLKTLLLGGILLIILGFAALLWIKSPGKADPFVDSDEKALPGSISIIEKITMGGEEQYLIIRGTDITKPVMLFLHGGPGSPEIAFIKKSNKAMENDFVMVYWEQRGAGKSFSTKLPVKSMNLKQFISDTKELSTYLAKRFNQEKSI